MEKFELNWTTSKLKGIKQYLTFINPIIKGGKMSPMEIEILSVYVYLDNKYKAYPKEIRESLMFSKDTRKKIVKFLDTSNDAFNNNMSSLYKKGYLSKEGKLKAFVPINKDNQIVISLNINLVEDVKDDFLNEQ